MGLSGSARTRASALFLILLIAGISGARGNRVLAQQEPAPAQRWDGLIELISGVYQWMPPTTEPPIPADGASEMSRQAISGDGRYIIFIADAPSLGYSTTALYIRDRRTGETRVQLGGPALEAVISADANHLAYRICDPWMRPDQLPICDVYALDLRNWAWTLISGTTHGEHGDADSGEPAISADGRFIVYQTTATNILGRPSAAKQLVMRDRDPDRNGIYDEPGPAMNELISVTGNPVLGDGDSATAEVSDDGRFVAFRSLSTNLPGAGTPGMWNVFRRDVRAHRTLRINLRPDGSDSPYSVTSPAISMSADGQVIAFASADPLLTWGFPDDTNQTTDVFVFDATASPSIKRIDIGEGWPVAEGYVPGNGPSEWPSISADGRYVAFQSQASNAAVASPPPAGSTQVYVFDRVSGTPSRISVKPDGTDPDADSVKPQIASDGSLVTFMSQALNLSRNVQTPFDRVYAAVHLEITPEEVTVPGSGGVATFTVTTQQHTQWWVDWTVWYDWLWFESPPMGVGSGLLSVRPNQANPEPTRRTADIKVHDRLAKLTQLEGLSMTSVTPSAGPSAGGTAVTIRGTGFEPGVIVEFGGAQATSVQIVDTTTIIATTPAHETGTVWVAVFSPDWQRSAWIDQAFRFLDGTPPEIWWWINGNVGGDGWYTSDATVNWWPWDEQTPVTSSTGCGPTTLTVDTPGTTFTCTATSEGGTSSASVTVRRDTTPPEVQIVTPMAAIYERGSTVIPELSCSDASSGVVQCGEVPSPAPLDTSYPGRRSYFPFAIDRAGNFGYATAEYAVSTGICAGTTPGLKLWFEFEGNGDDSVHGSPVGGAWPQYAASEYTPGQVGQALSLADWRFFNFNHQLSDVNFTSAMTFAAWIRADGQAGEAGVIASKEDQFRIARFADGTLRWAFNNESPGYTWVDTQAVIPQGTWTHVAVTYDSGVVKSYINGRLVHTHQGTGEIQKRTGLPFWGPWLSLGNRHDPVHNSAFIGAIDEVQFSDVVWDGPMVDALFFAGARGMCRLTPTVAVAALSTTAYGSSSYQARAQLRVASTQLGLPGKTVRLVSYVRPGGAPVGTATLITDADGWVTWDAPMSPTASVNTYSRGFELFFDSDLEYGGSTAIGEVTVNTATPAVTWPTPLPIAYGTPLSTTQLNATAPVPGLFLYSPFGGTVLEPGSHTLSVTFDPDDWNYRNATASVTLVVTKVAPSLTWNQPAAIVYGTELGSTELNATSNVAGTWSYAPGSGTLLSAGVGQPLTATFTPADTAHYDSASITTTIDVLKATPTIAVTSAKYVYDGQPHPVEAVVTGVTGGVLGPVTITYNGSSNAPVNAGTYDVIATFAGDTNHAAVSATCTVTIVKATPSLSWSQPAPIVYGTRLSPSIFVASSSVPGTFTYAPESGTLLNAGSGQILTASFVPADLTNYNDGSVSTTIDVAKATPGVIIAGGSYVYDGTAHPANAAATGVLGEELTPLSFVYNGSGAAPVNTGNYEAVATFAGNGNYLTASATATIVIAKAPVALNWTSPGAIVYGTPLGAAHLNATANVPGTFSYSPAAGTLLNAGVEQTLTATFTPADPVNYDGSVVTTTIGVAKATPVISVSGGSFTYDGTPHAAAGSAVGVGGENLAPLTITYNGSPSAPVNAGNYLVAVSYAGSANYESATETAALTIGKAQAVVTWPAPAAIVYGTPLGSAQLNATASVPGSFSYSPAAGAVLNAGVGQTLTVTFMPADPVNYDGGVITTTIGVAKASPVISVTGGSFTYNGGPHPAPGSVTGVGGESLGPLTITYNGSTTAPVNAGNYLVSASYSGSANYESASATATLTIGRAQAVITWPAPAPIVYGTPLGAAQFNATADVPGSFSYSPGPGTVLSAGNSQALSAVFTPADAANYTGGPASATINVQRAPLAIRANDAVKPFGAPVPAFGASASGFVNGDSFASLGGAIVFATTAGQASPVGTYPIVPSGVTSANYAIAFAPGTLTVVRGSTAVSLATGPSPSGNAEPMTFSATVAVVAPAAGQPTGTVRFFDGTTLLGSAPLAGGQASLTTAGLDSGFRTIEARYDGDGSFESSSEAVSHLVQNAAGTPVIAISSSRNPSNAGQTVTLTANVTLGSGSTGGTIEFYDGAALIGSAPIAAGRATLTTGALAAGSHAITARYAGFADVPPSRSPVFVQAVGASGWKNRATTMALSSSANPSVIDAPVTYIADVTGSSGSLPNGRILFMINGQVVGDPSGVVVTALSGSTARATFTVTGLKHGAHKVTATYLGDPTYKGSTALVPQAVN
jgi:Concanavalin A-like lectin/glucanases superfamily/MBG domain (YGX type)/Bacterial Ig-like domain (group 3)/IPT/TIG domain/MBG domain/WD40-like Beta Propeller Repeat